MADFEVRDHPSASRYEIVADGQVAGFVTYRANPGRLALIHTEVLPDFEGHGVGSRLAAGVLDDIRRRGLAVVPICPYIKAFIDRHPDYADLVAGGG